MNNKYQLIHIDSNEVTMCEKINIDGKDYYLSDGIITDYYYNIHTNNIHLETNEKRLAVVNKHDRLKVLATTNTSLKCPQVVDYVEELAVNRYKLGDYKHLQLTNAIRTGFVIGYNQHSETHSLSDEEVLQFVDYCINKIIMSDYIHTLNTELLQRFKSTLPTKVYYR